MLDSFLAWFGDWRHVAFLVVAVALLYVAREAAHRLIRTLFLLAAHGFVVVERWVKGGAVAA